MEAGELIKYRFYTSDNCSNPWTFGILMSSCDKINNTIEIFSQGQVVEVHLAAIEIKQA